MPTSPHYDVVVAGGRPAGAATALLLARQGARVMLLDRSRPGTDTLYTHALLRGAVLLLHRWGVLPAVIAAGTPAVRSVTFHLPDVVSMVPVKASCGWRPTSPTAARTTCGRQPPSWPPPRVPGSKT